MALLFALLLVAASCSSGDDDDSDDALQQPDDAADEGDGDPVETDGPGDDDASDPTGDGDDGNEPEEDPTAFLQMQPASGALLNPAACLADTLPDKWAALLMSAEEVLGGDPFDPGQPIPLDGPPHFEFREVEGEDPPFFGPMYRPGVLVADADYDPGVLLPSVLLEPVELTDVPGPSIDGRPPAPLNPQQLEVLAGSLSLWWIASASSPELLDPAYVATQFPNGGLEPVYIMVPGAGHMYGPEGFPEAGTTSESVASVYTGDGSVYDRIAIIDTSFDVPPEIPTDLNNLPDPLDNTDGHGSFIAGIVKELLPGVDITTAELGQPAQVLLSEKLGKPIEELYGPSPFGSDLLDLSIALAVMAEFEIDGTGTTETEGTKASDDMEPDFAAINMSFGTYVCDLVENQPGPTGLEKIINGLNTPIFAAAGNDDGTDPWYPAGFTQIPDLWSVGATDPAGVKAWFSNHGPWVDVCVQGESVTTRPYFIENKGTLQETEYTTGLIRWNGTSFATPTALALSLTGGLETATRC